MIFGFGKKEVEEEEEVEQVLFQGALNGKRADMAANAKLAEAALAPAKQLVSEGLSKRAGVIRLEPKGERAVVYNIIDGMAYPGLQFPGRVGSAVVQMLKVLGGMDPKQRSKPQAGGIKAEYAEMPYELKIETTPIAKGAERLIIRAQNMKEVLDSAEDIGIPGDLKNRLREVTSDHTGVVLVCGPPMSGTSTTLHGVMRSLDGYTHAIFNLADLGGREIKNVSNFEHTKDEELGTILLRLVRAEGEIVLVDPIRSSQAAKHVFSFADQIAVIAESEAKDAPSGILKVYQAAAAVDKEKECTEHLKGVLTQKLIRKLCKTCRIAYRPNPKLVAKVGLPKDTKALYRHPKKEETQGEDYVPCPECAGLGYRGQTALIEFFEVSDAIRELLPTEPSLSALKAVARKEKMVSIQKRGLSLVTEGETSLEELQRVMKAD